MSKFNEVECARRVLFFLNSRSYFVTTQAIFDHLELKDNANARRNLITVLNRLVACGTLLKVGEGKFKWMMRAGVEWSTSSPFMRTFEVLPSQQRIAEVIAEEAAPKRQVFARGTGPVTEAQQTEAESDDQWADLGDSEAAAAVRELERLYAAMSHRLDAEALYTERLKEEVAELRAVASRKVVEVKRYKQPSIKIKAGAVPTNFQKVLDLATCRRNILLVGPAGCGKTTMAEMVAKALGLPFAAIVCTSGMSESHLLGKELQNLSDGSSNYRTTEFVRCYEEGGVFLLDELDAADPNVLLCINSALSNGYINLPGRSDKPRAVKHEDFVCIASANTFGKGANRTYAGRNQLDESTIDRFRMGQVECDYDLDIEATLCPDRDLQTACWSIRNKIASNGLRRIMSTRFMADAYIMMSSCKWTVSQILESFFQGWSTEEKRKVM